MVATSGVTYTVWGITIFVIAVASVILLIYFTRRFKKIKNIPRDTKLEIYGELKKFVDGHTHGWVKEIKTNWTKRSLIAFYPEDYTQEEIEQMDEFPIRYVAVEKMYPTAKGRHSRGFGIIRVLSKDVTEMASDMEEFPPEFKRGFARTKIEENLRDTTYIGIREGNEALTPIVRDLNTGELSRDAMAKLKEIQREMIESKGIQESVQKNEDKNK